MRSTPRTPERSAPDRAPGRRGVSGGGRLAHEPALDGLRGLAVAAVVAFHADVPGTHGGYLGVSVFFTLSGYLITRLLLAEHGRDGAISMAGFYARRARRLIPASALCLLGIAGLAMLGAWSEVATLRRDLVGAALQIFNWVRLAGDGSYGAVFAADGGRPSPVEHYWSLSIEEQFYWVWPLVVAAVVRRARGRSVLGPMAAMAAAAVVAAPIIATIWGPDAAYWATPARVGEILTGAAAGVLVTERGSPRWTRSIAPVALAVLAVGVVVLPAVGGPAYAGWFPALSTITVVLLLGLAHDGPVRRGLAARPLVALGTISYGVYLYHWPVFTLIDEARLGRGGIVLLAVRLAITFAIAIASFRLLERPVRRASIAPRPALVGAAVATVAVLVAALLVPETGPVIDTAGDAAEVAAIDASAPTSPLAVATASDALPGPGADPETTWQATDLVAPVPNRPVRILVLGDSTAKAAGGGLARWAVAHPELAQVTIAGAAGCGFVRGGTRVYPDREEEVPESCARYLQEEIAASVRELQPDVVLFITGPWDVLNQRYEGTGPLAPTDEAYRQRIAEGFAEATRQVLDAGAPRVVWATEPTANPYWNPVHSPQEEPERHAVLHDEMRAVAAADPDRVAVAPLAWWLDEQAWVDDHARRPDGVHLTAEAAQELAERWLGPVTLAAALRGR